MKKTFVLLAIFFVSFLRNAESQTILVLQPGPEGKDAQLWSIMPYSNYGDIPKFDCSGWTHYGVYGVNRGLIDFDLSAIPDSTEILDARLDLSFVCLEPTYFGHTGENEAYLQLVTAAWEEDSVTWANQPSTTQDHQVYIPASTDPYMDYLNIDVTTLMRKLLAEPEAYHGLMLKLLDENPYRCLLFASSDYNDTIEFRPKLRITYTSAPITPVAGFEYDIENLSVYFQDASQWADGCQWDFGDGNYSGDLNPAHTYAEIGEYTVSLVSWNRNGADTVTRLISVGTTGLAYLENITLFIYPNPARDHIKVSTDFRGSAEFTIFDLQGRAMISSINNYSPGETGIIDISRLIPGIYVARFSAANTTITRKIAITR
jgi:PKD repeat protein